MRRISKAGFKSDFVREALLPDWWEPSCEKDPSLLPDLEFRVARFLGVSLETVRSDAALRAPAYEGPRLRRVANIETDAFGPAIHAALQVAGAVVRSMPAPKAVCPPPVDAAVWNQQVRQVSGRFTLATIAADLWARGIPVVHLEFLPSPKFQGLACVVMDRPVILLGHANDEPARLAVHLTHEVGHVVHGDCTAEAPVVDEDETSTDDAPIERRAEEYAWRALAGGKSIPNPPAGTFRDWAKAASAIQAQDGIDAGVTIWSWANRAKALLQDKAFQQGIQALNALYLAQGGRAALRVEFDRNVNLEAASETDRALLKCLHLDPERNAAARRQ